MPRFHRTEPARRFLPMAVLALFSLAGGADGACAQRAPAGEARKTWPISDGTWPRGENLFDPGAWGARPAAIAPSRPKPRAVTVALPERHWRLETSDSLAENPVPSYSTFCVRTCDGFYWPLGFATPKGRLAQDAERCAARCGGKARLFMTPTPDASSADPAPLDTSESLVDLDGGRYRDMEGAYLYRAAYMPRCGCKPYRDRLVQEVEVDVEDEPSVTDPLGRAKARSAAASLLLAGIVKRHGRKRVPPVMQRQAMSGMAARLVGFRLGD